MKTLEANADASQMAASVAPEDIHCGDYIAVLNVIYEYPSFLWCCDAASVQPDEPVRIQLQQRGGGTPLKVKAICLPFVFVKTPNGKSFTYDIRQTQFVRLNADYAKEVWNELK